MKTRSKPLYEYLLNLGVLQASKEEIAKAKQQYRKEYKKRWKKERLPHKEIRIVLSLKEYKEVSILAHQFNLTPTSYLKALLCTAIEEKILIPNRDKLLELLQLISICTIGTIKQTIPPWELQEQLLTAENRLLEYLNIQTTWK
jgi:hypothetical protein